VARILLGIHGLKIPVAVSLNTMTGGQMKKASHKPPSQPTRCAIYARTATVKQASEDNSIAKQVAACKRFAKRKGWIVRNDSIFADSGKSGLSANLGLKTLLRIATTSPKSFDALLCTAIDRIARNTGLVIRIYRALKKRGVEIRFAEDDTVL
jgi:DNA invertase Pin-like site-specific DNA recombinase